MLVVLGVVIWLVAPSKSHHSSTHASPGPHANAGPTVTGDAVKKVLLNGTELSKMLGQPFAGTLLDEQQYGGLEAMGKPSTAASPDCFGVVVLASRSVYESAGVQSYAAVAWGQGTPDNPAFMNAVNYRVIYVNEAVVALDSAADAAALFAKFSEQWKHCDGQRVSEPAAGPGGENTDWRINDVRVTDSVLAATAHMGDAGPYARAIGVQGNCLVEVSMPFNNAPEEKTGTADINTSGIDVARAMMDKVSKLS
ncbi:hypothetical protein BKN37_12140 [Mycobacterium talmoniae]|uniref:PknH-like extracellular domain-containing protein n=1 Tax=Mycobacterium talmoniae TaxID=1858794 RepID=A0A1S1NEB9_9MYCO|nr:hypothetical protein BKN37_12140 [Mycobacterium talmoniae]